jgi:ABC-type polysaccharide/polyol phosphate export permease
MVFKVLRDWFGGTNKLERFWLLAKIEYKLRYYENVLGLIWALVKPISDIIIYYIAFEIILKMGVPQFISFLFIGIILWTFFVESSSGTIQILATKKYLYEYTNMNKIEIYLAAIGSNLIGLFFNLCMFFIYFLLFEKQDDAHVAAHLSWHCVFLIPVILNLVILSLGFSLILSSLYIFAKDITQIWMIIINLFFWISPIMFKPELVESRLPAIRYINPISSIVINARNVVMYHHLPDWRLMAWGFIYATFFLLVGIYLLNTLGSKAAEKL